jgi:hypothetical protein
MKLRIKPIHGEKVEEGARPRGGEVLAVPGAPAPPADPSHPGQKFSIFMVFVVYFRVWRS